MRTGPALGANGHVTAVMEWQRYFDALLVLWAAFCTHNVLGRTKCIARDGDGFIANKAIILTTFADVGCALQARLATQ